MKREILMMFFMLCVTYASNMNQVFDPFENLQKLFGNELSCIEGVIMDFEQDLQMLEYGETSESQDDVPLETEPQEILQEIPMEIESEIKEGLANHIDPKTVLITIHELAKFHQIDYEYRLISFTGPDHDKLFLVSLNFGNEQYSATGSNIREAKRAAAVDALQHTAYELKPANKAPGTVSPLVELQGLIGETKKAINFIPEQSTIISDSEGNPVGVQFNTILLVDETEFRGSGSSTSEAKNAAAEAAINFFLSEDDELSSHEGSPQQEKDFEEITNNQKTALSLLYELTTKLGLSVNFQQESEDGPNHAKVFEFTCQVGDEQTTGTGLSKKAAKQEAAEKMLHQLQDVPMPEKKKNKSNKNKITKKNPEAALNPLQRLTELGAVCSMWQVQTGEWNAECTLLKTKATAQASRKKVAKRLAAENLMKLLDQTTPHEEPTYDSEAIFTVDLSDQLFPKEQKKYRPKVDVPSRDTSKTFKSQNMKKGFDNKRQRKLKAIKAPPQKDSSGTSESTKTHNPTNELSDLAKRLKFDVQYLNFPKSASSDHWSTVSLWSKPPLMCRGFGHDWNEARSQAALAAVQHLRTVKQKRLALKAPQGLAGNLKETLNPLYLKDWWFDIDSWK